jgi:nifR3 family TIM-barrel protein
MIKGFWANLNKPFFVLAPLANVTDAAFRRVIAKYSKPNGPDVFWTEFVSADGLVKGNKEILLRDLVFTEAERPIVAQFFTSTPENMEKAAELARELGFDGVDINMGCPDKSVEKQGAGAKLIKNPDLAVKIIEAAKKGAGNLPVSVKTRIGFNQNEIETWLPKLLSTDIPAITIHARTRKEMSKVDAHWDVVKRAVEIRDESGKETLIIGNGDVKNIEEAKKRVEETGADGVMIGRGIFGNPWLFSKDKNLENISLEEKLQVMLEHTKTFVELLGDIKSFAIMKKHYKAYVNGFDGAKELRASLMEAKDYEEIERLTKDFLLLKKD